MELYGHPLISISYQQLWSKYMWDLMLLLIKEAKKHKSQIQNEMVNLKEEISNLKQQQLPLEKELQEDLDKLQRAKTRKTEEI